MQYMIVYNIIIAVSIDTLNEHYSWTTYTMNLIWGYFFYIWINNIKRENKSYWNLKEV